MPHSHSPQEVALFRIAGRGENLRTGQVRDLYRCQADSACACLNQNSFALSDAAQIMKCVPRSHECDRDGHRLFKTDSRRLANHGDRRDRDVRSEAARAGGDDFVARFESAHTFSGGHDSSGTFVAQRSNSLSEG